MSQDLLRDALKQAEHVPAAVRSAALCHIARVLNTSDASDARRLLEEGLALAANLPDAEERKMLLAEGAVLAATIAPARAFEILATLGDAYRNYRDQVVFGMIDHGFTEAATAFLADAPIDAEFRFGLAMHALGGSTDDERKRTLLRRAIAAMRRMDANRRRPPFGLHDYVHFFSVYWRLLPTDEARAAIREHVQRILAEPDADMNGSFGAGSAHVTFSSTHQHHLFEILELLQELDRDLAASIIPRYPELSAAAWRYPLGLRTMNEEMEQEAMAARSVAPPPDAVCMDYVGSTPIQDALRTEFGEPFAVAMDEYDRDTDPDDRNEVPKQCWPSAAAFRTTLYKAGQYEGAAAARYLERIPDPELRLFAQIELAAALAGLPQLGSTTIRRGSRTRRRMARAQPPDMPALSEIPPKLRPLPPARKPDLTPSRELRVSPATRGEEGVSGGSGSDFVEIRNAPIASVVSYLFDTPPTRIEWPPSMDPSGRYDFVLVLANGVSIEEKWRLMREGVAVQFKVRLSIEERIKDAWVLTAPNGIKARARRAPERSGFGFMHSGWTSIQARHESGNPHVSDALRLREILRPPERPRDRDQDPRHLLEQMRIEWARSLAGLAGAGEVIDGLEGELSITELCAILETGLQRPLINETHLTDRYMIAFESDTPGNLPHALLDRLGLVLSEGRYPVMTLVVSPA